MNETFPVVSELSPAPRAEEAFARLAARPHCIFFDSARWHARLGRYSYLAADPFDFLVAGDDASQTWESFRRSLAKWKTAAAADIPPFQGGAAGLLSYELGGCFERMPNPRLDEFGVPKMAIGLYDVVLAFDHATNRAWLVSQGFPETEPSARRDRAHARLRQFREWLAAEPASSKDIAKLREEFSPGAASVPAARLAAQFSVDADAALTSDFSPHAYRAAVARAIEYIRAGDIFQVNLSQRLLHPALEDAVPLYLRLRERNAATFGAYFDLGAFQIASSSPERFLRLSNDQVEARPIKGTRRRAHRPEADLFAGDELRQSEKDRAENVMIVDLLRNDLSRVCRHDSVRVTQLCEVEIYEYVQHLVSAIEGRLEEGVTPCDLLSAAFPGGSITGAPKVRAMEIIAELEPTARGAYCGSLAWLGFDGSLDTSILIRTVTAGRGWWQLNVGGGVVSQSSPEDEYLETWHKAQGMLHALRP